MPDAIITSTASTFGTISGTFAADQSTITGTVTGIVAGTLSGSVGVPGPAGPAGAGVPAGGTAGQYLQKIDGVDYNTDWVTLNLSAYAPLNSPAFTGNPTAPTAALGDNDTSLATTAFVQQELLSGTANAKNLEVYVRNQTGSTLAAGAIVYINGATGNRPTVTLAQANNDANSAQTMGFVKTAIANNGFGYVIVRGEVEGLDTQAVAEGTQLYLSPTVAGAYTTTKPSAPQHLVYVGIVIRSHPTQGVILVAVQNGYELHELHDVSLSSEANNDLLVYESATDLWKNKSFATLGLLTSGDLSGYATESFVTSQGYLTDAPSDGNQYARMNGAWDIVSAPPSYITSVSSPLSVSSGDLTIDLTLYATESWVTSGFYSSTNPSGYITSSALLPYLLSGTAASTYQTIAGMSSYLTTSAAASTYLTQANAASTYFTIASAANKADLASPVFTGDPQAPTPATSDNDTSIATTAFVKAQGYLTSAPVTSVAGKTGAVTLDVADVSGAAPLASPTFTGTPSLPTGTIAVTQSPGNNTTAVATTAFVTAAVPAFASIAQLVEATSTSTSLAPGNQGFVVTNPRLRSLSFINQTSLSGTGANATTTQTFARQMYLNSLGVGRSAYSFGAVGSANAGFGTSTAKADQVDFSKKVWLSGYAMMGYSGTPSYLGDANTMCRITLGGYSTNTTGEMTLKGIGLKKVGGVGSFVTLTVHNGTTRTDVASSVTIADGAGINWQIYSDGTGNVTLYINGTQAATTNAGPTTATASGQGFYREQVEAVSTPTVRQIMNCNGGWFYSE